MEYWLIPYRHDAWATRGMIEMCRTLDEEAMHRRFDIGCGSLHDTFLHMIGCMARWSERISQRPLGPSLEADKRRRSVDELLMLLESAARDLEATARDVHEGNRYSEPIEWPRKDKPPYRFSKGAALVHVTTHGMHHRAQARWMMRQLGIDLGERDFDPIEMELVQTGQFENIV
jgi:uncharacterized damage-inducible protein DinB